MPTPNNPRRRQRAIAAVGATLIAASLAACGSGAGGSGDTIKIGLVTKTDTNPFYVQMRKAVEAEAEKSDIEVQSFSGRENNDNDSQVEAMDNLISQQVDGILIAPADSAAIVPSIERARDAGITVIAVDTPAQPTDAVDETFATDNFKAGQLIGQWAKTQMEGKDARIALLDQDANNTSVDVARNQGFLDGFGIELNDETKNGDEDDPQIVGNFATRSERDEGRTQMENALQKDRDLNLVYAINEVVAAGAYEAIVAAGREDDVLMVSVDGGCPGVQSIADGTLGATAMQFPAKMAVDGVRALVAAADGDDDALDGGVTDTGSALITDQPVDGLDSQDSTWGLDQCWG